MKYISYRDLKCADGVLCGDATRHFKGDGSDCPEQITVRGKYYAIRFKKGNCVRNHENKVLHWVYEPDSDDPRVQRMRLHINNDIKPKEKPKPKAKK